MTKTHPATAQRGVDEAFEAAFNAARASGGPCFATDDAGMHLYVQRHAPGKYAEFQRIHREARAAMCGSKYEGAIA